MEAFFLFFTNSMQICRDMLNQFTIVSGVFMAPIDWLSEFFGAPVSIISIMVGTGVTVYITRVLFRFFSGI